jgi:hypothetical protein
MTGGCRAGWFHGRNRASGGNSFQVLEVEGMMKEGIRN